jgi:hypothetical protein
MKEELDEILKNLLSINHKDITNLRFEEGKFSFEYGGGKFILIKSVSANLTTGYLTLYHETPFLGSNHLLQINDFIIKTTKDYNYFELKIKNHIDFSNSMHRRTPDSDGYINLNQEDLKNMFAKQLISKLINDNFDIYLTGQNL